MSARYALSNALLRALSSAKLALTLVLLVILFSLAGAVLPQAGMLEPAEIAQWQEAHPGLTRILEPAGLFHVFHCWPFLVTISILAVNTLTCTVLRFLREGGFSALKGPTALERVGFLLLHLSLIALLAGGFYSAATRLDGYIVLTEGQRFEERHEHYLRLVEGPLRPERHKQFSAVLRDVQTEYQSGKQVDVESTLEITADGRKTADGLVKFNRPVSYQGVSFTLQDTGFSPHIVIGNKETGRVRVDSFVALKTFGTEQGRQYRDFLPLPFLPNRTVLTLYPSHSIQNGNIVKTGEQPENPLLLIETEDESGRVISSTHLPIGQQVAVGNFNFGFTDLRRWSAFRVVDDNGYPIVWVALWLGTAALVLRYVPELRNWFAERQQHEPSTE
jgi:cytochrome c biogenesis protein ResB